MMIDGPSLIFRAYFGARSRQMTPGDVVNGIPGFLDRLARVIVERRPTRLVVAEDRAWRPAWRVELMPSYKSHRVAEPVPPDLAPQLPVIRRILEAVGVDVVGVDEYEAEDVIATLAALAAGSVEILSGDRDLFALVDGARVRVLYPGRGGYAVIDEDEVSRCYGIPGRRYADFAILRGDPSDGLPGLKGVGSVGAAGLIRRHETVEGVLRDRFLREADREYLERAIRVVTPAAELPLALPRGRRDRYPADEAGLASLLAAHDAEEAGSRLSAALQAVLAG
jgi:5'-3' exonuclease